MSVKSRGSGPPPPPQSWYPVSVIRPQPLIQEASSDAAGTSARSGALPKANSSAGFSDDTQPFPPRAAEAPVATLDSLNNKSVSELAEMVKHEKTYSAFLYSLEPLRQSKAVLQDMRKSNMDQARMNLQAEATIAELKNQCAIIRTTELAVAREAFEEAKLREEGIVESRSPARFVTMLEEAATEADEESENMHRRLLDGELAPIEFISNYRILRLLYHRRMLQRLAAVTPGSRVRPNAALHQQVRSDDCVDGIDWTPYSPAPRASTGAELPEKAQG